MKLLLKVIQLDFTLSQTDFMAASGGGQMDFWRSTAFKQ